VIASFLEEVTTTILALHPKEFYYWVFSNRADEEGGLLFFFKFENPDIQKNTSHSNTGKRYYVGSSAHCNWRK
jgi:hypothetical protein